MEAVRDARDLVPLMRAYMTAFDAEVVPGPLAVELLSAFTELKNMAAAGETLMTRRVEVTNAWKSSGAASVPEFVASVTGASSRDAAATLAASRRLESQPEVVNAFLDGKLNEHKAVAISRAVEADPTAERELVRVAVSKPANEVQKQCRAVECAVRSAADDAELLRKARRARRAGWWVDDKENLLRIELAYPLDVGAGLKSRLDAAFDKRRRLAKSSHESHTFSQLRADAVVDVLMASGGSSVPVRHQAVMHFDYDAYARGFATRGERCEITGIGPVPVTVIRSMMSDAYLRVIVEKGGEQRLVNIGRPIPAAVLAQVTARDATCAVPGCEVDVGLEFDHRRPDSECGPATVTNIARLCWAHHQMKSHHGWCLVGPPGEWIWIKRRDKGDGGSGYPLDDDDESLREEIALARSRRREDGAGDADADAAPGPGTEAGTDTGAAGATENDPIAAMQGRFLA